MKLKALLNFKEFVTPSIMKIVYWVALTGIAIVGLAQLIRGMKYDSAAELIGGLLFLVLAPLYLRVLCELILVAFQISTDLSAMRYYTENREISSDEEAE